jgi:hypothetical protein
MKRIILVVTLALTELVSAHAQTDGARLGALLFDLTSVYVASNQCPGVILMRAAMPFVREMNAVDPALLDTMRPNIQKSVTDTFAKLAQDQWCATVMVLYGPNGTQQVGWLSKQ